VKPHQIHKAHTFHAAHGPGSNEGRGEEAAKFFEDCHSIHYRVGKPKMRRGYIWYLNYKASRGERPHPHVREVT
jgi:hypothetical protein